MYYIDNIDNTNTTENRSLFKTHMFFFLMMAWSIFIQFMPLSDWTYQPVALFLPCVVYFIFNKDAAGRVLKKYKPLKLCALFTIPLIWLCMMPLKIVIILSYNQLFGDKLSNIIASNPPEMSPWILILLSAVTPAIFEELLMRGIIFDGYRDKKIHIAAIMNGLIFGMMHLNTFQFVHTFISGITMTYLVYITGSIFSSMLMHFINNSFPQWLDILSGKATETTAKVAENSSSSSESLTIGVFIIFIFMAFIGVKLAIKLLKFLAKKYNVNLREEKQYSHEKILNIPLIGIIALFISFNAFLFIQLGLLG